MHIFVLYLFFVNNEKNVEYIKESKNQVVA
jgi:hypothetical protein